MDEKKIVTWEIFEKYHEQLMRYIKDADGLILEDELFEEEDTEEE